MAPASRFTKMRRSNASHGGSSASSSCAPAADVWIDRPEAHPGGGRAIQQASRIGTEVSDVLLFAQERGEARSRVLFLNEHRLLHGVSSGRVPNEATRYRTNPETARRRPGDAVARAVEC